MKATDVVHAYRDNEGDTNDNFQLVPTGCACRLMSFQIRQEVDPTPAGAAGAGYPKIELRDGGASGTVRFKFAYRVKASTVLEQFPVPVVNIPSHGIRFDDGIYVDLGLSGSAGIGGVVSATATVQGVTDHVTT